MLKILNLGKQVKRDPTQMLKHIEESSNKHPATRALNAQLKKPRVVLRMR